MPIDQNRSNPLRGTARLPSVKARAKKEASILRSRNILRKRNQTHPQPMRRKMSTSKLWRRI
jgi:hypothetical protein